MVKYWPLTLQSLLVFLDTQAWTMQSWFQSFDSDDEVCDDDDYSLSEVKKSVELIAEHFRVPLEAKQVSLVILYDEIDAFQYARMHWHQHIGVQESMVQVVYVPWCFELVQRTLISRIMLQFAIFQRLCWTNIICSKDLENWSANKITLGHSEWPIRNLRWRSPIGILLSGSCNWDVVEWVPELKKTHSKS